MFNFFRTQPKNYTDLNSEDFKKGMTAADAILIDVRSAGEFKSGKIKGARNIDITSGNFMNQIQNLPKDKKYYLYCRSGKRSGQACSLMANQGFENIYNLGDGIMGWPYDIV